MAILRGKRSLILLGTALLGLCVLGAYRGIDATRMLVTGQSLANDEHFRYPSWAVAHFAAAFFFAVAVPLQFWPAFRNRHRRLHRWSGRALLLVSAILGASGLWLVYRMPDRPVGERVFMTLVFAVFLLCLTYAFQAARARDFTQHRQWMIRAVAGALGSMTERLILPFFLAAGVHGMADFWDKFLAAAWVSWFLNLAIAEWWIRRTASRSADATPPRTAIAAALAGPASS